MTLTISSISAEIPDENDEPELCEIVKPCMIHGPCDSLNVENGVCKKNFPKEFREETLENGYPAYKRRNNDRTVTVGRFKYIVPYSWSF